MFWLVSTLITMPIWANPLTGFDVVETRNGQVVSYRKWKEKNIEIVDWDNPARSQGSVGSCQSFAFIGMIENRTFQNQGVTLDLSERYQLYSNFMEFSALGSNPAHMAEFPKFARRAIRWTAPCWLRTRDDSNGGHGHRYRPTRALCARSRSTA